MGWVGLGSAPFPFKCGPALTCLSRLTSCQQIITARFMGVLTLRRAIWVIIMEQGGPYPFVPAAPSWLSGHICIWGSVMHRGVLLPFSFTQKKRKIDAFLRFLRLFFYSKKILMSGFSRKKFGVFP